jgi:hypothetical protein
MVTFDGGSKGDDVRFAIIAKTSELFVGWIQRALKGFAFLASPQKHSELTAKGIRHFGQHRVRAHSGRMVHRGLQPAICKPQGYFCRNTITNRPPTWPTVAPPSQFRKGSLKWKPHN